MCWGLETTLTGGNTKRHCSKGPLHVRMSSNNIQMKRCRCRAKWRTGFKIVISVQKVRLLKKSKYLHI